MPVQKLRVIVLDGCCATATDYSSAEVTWLTNIALNTNYNVIVFSHMGTKANNTGSMIPNNGDQVETALNNFKTVSRKVLAFIHGHTHWDNVIEPSVSGVHFPYISLVQSWCISTGVTATGILGNPTTYTRKYGQYTEYAFDVFALNCETGEINMFRFGAGGDRVYSPS